MNIRYKSKWLQQSISGVMLAFFLIAQVAADEITLNLKDADIRALISTVSKFTGKNFIIDPRVNAKITVVSSETLTPEEVYEVFLSILQVHGYAAVPTGSVIKIVPEVNAKQGPLPLKARDTAGPSDELITKIIGLDHVPAAQLVPILRPLVPQQGHLAAYNPTNTLIITDHAGNIQRLVQIIQGVDKPESDELEVIPLKHASAPELVRIVNSLYPQSAKDQGNKINLAADERTNSILMSGERAIRLKIRTTIMQLDTPLDDSGGNTHVVYLRYAKAENMVEILTGIQEQQKQKKATVGTRAPAKAPAAAARSQAGASFISDNAIIQADEETNALIITADPNTLMTLKSVIRQLDIRRAQVHIEAIIAEISTNRDKEIGVGAVVDGTQSSDNTFPIGISNLVGLGDLIAAAAGDTDAAINVLSNLGSGLTVGVGSETSSGVRYGMILKALQTDSAANILSTPSIVTLDNEEAEIIVAQNLPFITGQFTGAGSLNPQNPFQTIERQDVGLTLKVTPQINEGDTIKLDLEQEVSDVVTITENSGPVTRKRSIKTSVLVDDGGILVLGGLIEEIIDDTRSKVPLLGDIPVLGQLFTSRASTKRKQNLMVFLKPSILRDFNDAAYVTNEKYNYLRAEQIREKEDDFGLIKGEPVVLPPLQPESLNKAQAKPANPDKTPVKASEPEEEWDWDDFDYKL
ncbi:MAG: type II secretion system secretin GspD [Gammaproteobacteria bacterium]